MTRHKSFRDKAENWLRGHPTASAVCDHGYTLMMTILSAAFFAFGYVVFLAPEVTLSDGTTLTRIVSGGMSGVSQVLTLAFEVIFPSIEVNESLAFSILYFVCNVPVIVLAYRSIGKRFTAYTLLNVALVSVFTSLFQLASTSESLLAGLVETMNGNGGMLCRALFAGVCTGLSSAIAFKADSSTGGLDVISYYIALKKSTSTGKYMMGLNAIVAIAFFLLSATEVGWEASSVTVSLASMFFTALYIFVSKLVIDSINIRNKKYKVEVVTSVPNLSDVLIDSLPHGATIIDGKGAFTGQEKWIITMVVTSFEVKDTVAVIQETDPKAFVQVSPLMQVYGRFFIKPVK